MHMNQMRHGSQSEVLDHTVVGVPIPKCVYVCVAAAGVQELQVPAQPLAWGEVYEDASRPLVLDVGCGYGRFPLALSTTMPTHNLLGLEIRESVGVGRG